MKQIIVALFVLVLTTVLTVDNANYDSEMNKTVQVSEMNKTVQVSEMNKTVQVSEMNKTVQVYYDSSDSSYKNIRYDLVTDVLWSFILINGDGSLNYDRYEDPSDFISLAHNKGVKVHLSFQETPGHANQFIDNPNARTNAIKNLLAEVKAEGFDGIDNDIETYSASQKDMTAFVKELYTAFKSSNPKYRVSMAVPVFNYHNTFNGSTIKNYIDYITIMAYFWDEKSPISGPVEPMLQDDNTDASVITGINYWRDTENIPINKILLGIPYYGYERETYSDKRLSYVEGAVKWVHLENVQKDYNYNRNFDGVWKTPWQVWNEDGQWHQLHYEDVESLTYKYNKVNSDNLAGISIWNINYGMNRQDLWQLIEDKFFKG